MFLRLALLLTLIAAHGAGYGVVTTCPQTEQHGRDCTRYVDGHRCTYGEECCCGVCYPAQILVCSNQQWVLRYNDQCLNRQCPQQPSEPVHINAGWLHGPCSAEDACQGCNQMQRGDGFKEWGAMQGACRVMGDSPCLHESDLRRQCRAMGCCYKIKRGEHATYDLHGVHNHNGATPVARDQCPVTAALAETDSQAEEVRWAANVCTELEWYRNQQTQLGTRVGVTNQKATKTAIFLVIAALCATVWFCGMSTKKDSYVLLDEEVSAEI